MPKMSNVGATSNVGTGSSRISLQTADVVDGKGNTFNLHGPAVGFRTDQTSNISGGARAKYTVTGPEKDPNAKPFFALRRPLQSSPAGVHLPGCSDHVAAANRVKNRNAAALSLLFEYRFDRMAMGTAQVRLKFMTVGALRLAV
jgi:hypothetical protein